MADKTKFDYEIEDFCENFKDKKNKNIVIYGIGRRTATLVETDIGFKFVGLCDKDNSLVGTTCYGLPVLSRDEAEKADLLIINTTKIYWNTIYKRIQNWNIPIYFCNGKLAKLKESKRTEHPYWESSSGELKEEIEAHDIVSFDIFDTLVMRKIMSPYDVFRLVNRKIGTDTFVHP